MRSRKDRSLGMNGADNTRILARALAIIFSVVTLIGINAVMSALAESEDIPAAVVDPALTGTWGFHQPEYDLDLVFTFNADGTGYYYMNGMNMPIVSYVSTTEPYITEYEEEGTLLTIYYGEMTETMGDSTYTISLDPIEYGYKITGDTLRIIFSRDIANHYTDYTRE